MFYYLPIFFFFPRQVKSLGHFLSCQCFSYTKSNWLACPTNMKELTEAIPFNSNLASDLMFQLKLNKHAWDVFTVYVE